MSEYLRAICWMTLAIVPLVALAIGLTALLAWLNPPAAIALLIVLSTLIVVAPAAGAWFEWLARRLS